MPAEASAGRGAEMAENVPGVHVTSISIDRIVREEGTYHE
jgi:hypothetical protein